MTFHCYLHFHSTNLVLFFIWMCFCTNQMYILLYLFWKGILSCTGKDCHKFVEVIGELVLSLLAAFATPLKTNAVISPANSYLNGRFHTRDGLSVFKICQNWRTNRCIKSETYYLSDTNYRKIPKISPGAYIFQRPFLSGLFFEGLIFGGAYLRREISVSKSIELAL